MIMRHAHYGASWLRLYVIMRVRNTGFIINDHFLTILVELRIFRHIMRLCMMYKVAFSKHTSKMHASVEFAFRLAERVEATLWTSRFRPPRRRGPKSVHYTPRMESVGARQPEEPLPIRVRS